MDLLIFWWNIYLHDCEEIIDFQGNGSPETVTKELAMDDCVPANLSPLRDAKYELPEIKVVFI